MPKAKQSNRRKKYDYGQDRKKLKKQFKKREAPRIECPQIRKAWNDKRSVAHNLRDMGLAFDPNRALPIKKPSIFAEEKDPVPRTRVVRKPYVVNQLETEANLPKKNTKTLSLDMVEFVQYMVRGHGDNYKAMARDEKNYYQHTPKQIKRQINDYRHCHPEEYESFMKSLSEAAGV